MAAQIDNPQKKKRSRGKRRKRLEISSDSSSEEEEIAPIQQPVVDTTIQSESDDDDSSSLGLTSSDEEEPPEKQSKILPEPSQYVQVNGQSIKPLPYTNRQRTPSPPIFGVPDLSKEPFLHGYVASDNQKPVDSQLQAKFDKEQKLLTAFYTDNVIANYGKELDTLKQEKGIENRLGLLIRSLAAGADHQSINLPPDLESWRQKAAQSTDRNTLLDALQRETQDQPEDVDMQPA